jgi:tryptophan synthase alpha chain
MSRISEAFSSKGKDRGLLITYTMGGYPSYQLAKKICKTLAEGGSDILELGIPFSDPIADGPSIQNASAHSISIGIKPIDVLELARSVRARYDMPIVLMTYYNIIYSAGTERFISKAREFGADGLIVPDILMEEADELIEQGKRKKVDIIPMASPVTGRSRLRNIANKGTGFLYLVSTLGVTGARDRLPQTITNILKFVKSNAKSLPVAVGFGISNPEQVRLLMNGGADGVVVGSAIIDRINRNLGNEERALTELKEFVASMREATSF